MSILLAEDDEVLGPAIARALRREGWRVDALADGLSARTAAALQTA